ncbi:MAG: phasin family protein [Magnetococcales bacterium]|nr:phasin family protein [Magnetococcales bacterium]
MAAKGDNKTEGEKKMDPKMTEKMTEITKSAFDSMIKLQKINDEALQKLAKRQMETANSCMQAGVKHFKAMGDSKDVKDASASQASLTAEMGELLMAHASATMEVFNSSKDELSQLMENNIKRFLDVSKG